MKYNWMDEELREIKNIFEGSPDPTAHDKIKEFIARKFSRADAQNNAPADDLLRGAYFSATQIARRRGWLKEHHDAHRSATAWPEEKKQLLKKLVEEDGLTNAEILENPEFRTETGGYRTDTFIIYNWCKSLGIDTKKRSHRGSPAKKDIWGIPGLETRCRQLIQEG